MKRCVVALLLFATLSAHSQAREGVLSAAEVEKLRDTADQPADRLKAYEQFISDREKEVHSLLNNRHAANFAFDVHEALEQISGIADELNDNLDDWSRKHRDLRKSLPKLISETERWETTLRAPERDDRYEIVRHEALDAVRDTHSLAGTMLAEQTSYFKNHPKAISSEKKRRENPNAPEGRCSVAGLQR